MPADFAANQLNTSQPTPPLPRKALRKEQAIGYVEDERKETHESTMNGGIRYSSPLHKQHNSGDPCDNADRGGYCRVGAIFYQPSYPYSIRAVSNAP